MSIAVVLYNTLLLQVHHEKEEQICHKPELSDGAVIALLAPWRG